MTVTHWILRLKTCFYVYVKKSLKLAFHRYPCIQSFQWNFEFSSDRKLFQIKLSNTGFYVAQAGFKAYKTITYIPSKEVAELAGRMCIILDVTNDFSSPFGWTCPMILRLLREQFWNCIWKWVYMLVVTFLKIHRRAIHVSVSYVSKSLNDWWSVVFFARVESAVLDSNLRRKLLYRKRLTADPGVTSCSPSQVTSWRVIINFCDHCAPFAA